MQRNKYTCLFFLLFVIMMGFNGCYQEDDYNFSPEDYSSFLQISFDKDSIPADGKSSVIISASIDALADDSLRNVSFSTNKGSFLENSTKTYTSRVKELDNIANNRLVAKAELVSSLQVETAKVSANIGNVEPPAKTIKFYRAYPSTISLQPNVFAIKQSYISESTVTATIKREIGIPSIGQLVNFFVVNSTNDTVVNTTKRIGNYRALLDRSDDKGNTSMVFTLGDTTYIGKLRIYATTTIPNGTNTKVLKDSTHIFVTK